MNAEQLAYDIAERRIEALTSESAAFARREELRSALERGLTAVGEYELRLLEEACAEIEARWAREQAAEIEARLGSWVREDEALCDESYWHGGEAAVS